jgi:hypothetical protein
METVRAGLAGSSATEQLFRAMLPPLEDANFRIYDIMLGGIMIDASQQ